MAALLSLPNELILDIYTSMPDLESAARLSSVNKRLRNIWLENDNQIADAILRPQIPDYEDAVELAILEETVGNDAQLSHVKGQIPTRFYLRRLLTNANLASSAVTAWTHWMANLTADNYRHHMSYTSPYASYYLMRKIVLAHQHPEARLQQALYATLRTESYDAVLTHSGLNEFLTGRFDHDIESERHGIFKSEEDWTEEEEMMHEMNYSVLEEEWNYVSDVLHAAMQEKVHGYQNLKGKLFNGIQVQN